MNAISKIKSDASYLSSAPSTISFVTSCLFWAGLLSCSHLINFLFLMKQRTKITRRFFVFTAPNEFSHSQQTTLLYHKNPLRKFEYKADNAQRLIAMQSNILTEMENEGLWGIGSQGIRYETCSSVNFSLYIKSHWSRTKERLQIRSTKALLWELQSELMSIDTLSHSVLPYSLSSSVSNNISY